MVNVIVYSENNNMIRLFIRVCEFNREMNLIISGMTSHVVPFQLVPQLSLTNFYNGYDNSYWTYSMYNMK